MEEVELAHLVCPIKVALDLALHPLRNQPVDRRHIHQLRVLRDSRVVVPAVAAAAAGREERCEHAVS